MGQQAQAESEQERLLRQLASSDRAARMAAIEALAQVGDEAALEAMRDRLRLVGREHQALIIAIGTLRWRLSGEAYSSLDHHQ